MLLSEVFCSLGRNNNEIYQSPLILPELFQHNLVSVSYLISGHDDIAILNDVANDAESTQKLKITS